MVADIDKGKKMRKKIEDNPLLNLGAMVLIFDWTIIMQF